MSIRSWFRRKPDPPQAAAIAALSDQITTLGARLMTAVDNLNAAVTRLTTAVNNQNARFDRLVQENADLKEQVAAGDPAVQAAADAVDRLAEQVEARASLEAAPASGPAPSP